MSAQDAGGAGKAALVQQGLSALRSRDFLRAAEVLETAARMKPPDAAVWLHLAGARRAAGDPAAAMAAVDAAIRIEPRNFLALLMRGSLLEREGRIPEAASAYAVALTQRPPLERLDPATRTAALHAEAVHRRHLDALDAHLRGRLTGSADGAIGVRRVDAFIERLTGRRAVYHQQPVQFAFPEMPPVEFYDRRHFPWLDEIEAAFPDIRGEFEAAYAGEARAKDFPPYVQYPDGVPLDQWAELNRSPRWGAYHLLQFGDLVDDHAERCPRTLAALAAAPQPRLRGRSPNAMFSLLLPRTRIPPHTGVSNLRLVTHLALKVPGGCGFRVGSQTRPWREGRAFVFDDTIEHEAWNDGDDWRAVLIFDVWSPFLSDEEKTALTEVMDALEEFSGAPRDAL